MLYTQYQSRRSLYHPLAQKRAKFSLPKGQRTRYPCMCMQMCEIEWKRHTETGCVEKRKKNVIGTYGKLAIQIDSSAEFGGTIHDDRRVHWTRPPLLLLFRGDVYERHNPSLARFYPIYATLFRFLNALQPTTPGEQPFFFCSFFFCLYMYLCIRLLAMWFGWR